MRKPLGVCWSLFAVCLLAEFVADLEPISQLFGANESNNNDNSRVTSDSLVVAILGKFHSRGVSEQKVACLS